MYLLNRKTQEMFSMVANNAKMNIFFGTLI